MTLVVTVKEGEPVEHAGVRIRILWAKTHKARIRVEKVTQENLDSQSENGHTDAAKSADIRNYTGD